MKIVISIIMAVVVLLLIVLVALGLNALMEAWTPAPFIIVGITLTGGIAAKIYEEIK